MLPTAGEFLTRFKTLTGLLQKKDTVKLLFFVQVYNIQVLVFISNQNWRPHTVGLLQRMYSPFFKATIFCGTWTDPLLDPGLLPPIEPLNFVNITLEEMRNGALYGYCVPKIKNLRLQDVTGEAFVSFGVDLFRLLFHC